MKRVTDVTALLLALALLGAGGAKVLGAEFEVAAFERFGLPAWSMLLTGVVEVLAAGMLAVRPLSTLGAIVAAGVMVVAIPASVVGEGAMAAAPPIAFLAALVGVGWQRRGALAHWLADGLPGA